MSSTTWANCSEHGRQEPARETYTDYRMMGGRRVVFDGLVRVRRSGDKVFCSVCQQPAEAKTLKTNTNPDEQCGAVCQSARGPRCDCSCRGQNHGA